MSDHKYSGVSSQSMANQNSTSNFFKHVTKDQAKFDKGFRGYTHLPPVNFQEWCKKRFQAPSVSEDPDIVRTHGFMGLDYQISVKRSELSKDMEELYDKYVEIVTHPIPQRICMDEKLSDPYCMFFQDLDVESNTPVEDEYMLDLCKIAVTTNSKFYPDLYISKFNNDIMTKEEIDNDPKKLQNVIQTYSKFNTTTGEWHGAGTGRHRLRCMVSFPHEPEEQQYGGSGKIPRTRDDGSIYYKHAAHLNYIGRQHVTVTEAKIINAFTVQEVERLCGPRNKENGENPWNSVFDSDVYKDTQGGVRMLLSHKVKRCKCHNHNIKLSKQRLTDDSQNEKCTKCENGWIWSSRRYSPETIYDADGNPDPNAFWIMINPMVFLRAACIRSKAKTIKQEWKKPKECRIREEDVIKTSVKQKGRPVASLPKGNIKKSGPWAIGDYIDTECETGLMLLQAINDAEDGWSTLKITSIYRQKDNRYVVYLDGNGHWCGHKGDYHGGSQIWFVIIKAGIIQKCRSVKHECKQWESEVYPIQEDLKELLFFDQIRKDPEMLRPRYRTPSQPSQSSQSYDMPDSAESSYDTPSFMDTSNDTGTKNDHNTRHYGTNFSANSSNNSNPKTSGSNTPNHQDKSPFFRYIPDQPGGYIPQQYKKIPKVATKEDPYPHLNKRQRERIKNLEMQIFKMSSITFPDEAFAQAERAAKSNNRVPNRTKLGTDSPDDETSKDESEEHLNSARKTGNRTEHADGDSNKRQKTSTTFVNDKGQEETIEINIKNFASDKNTVASSNGGIRWGSSVNL